MSPLFFSHTGAISISDDGQDPEDLDVEFVGLMPVTLANPCGGLAASVAVAPAAAATAAVAPVPAAATPVAAAAVHGVRGRDPATHHQ